MTGPLLFTARITGSIMRKKRGGNIMKIKKFIKTLIALDKLNQEFNQELNAEIKRLRAQVKEEEKNPKYWKPESISK